MLHFVRVEVGEEGVAAIFKTFYLLAHEFAGEIVDGLRCGQICRNLKVKLVRIVFQQQDEIDAYIDELVEQCVEQNGIKDNVDLAWKCAVCLLYLQKKCPAEKSLKMVG